MRPSRNLTFAMLDELGRSIITGRFDDARFPTEGELAVEYGVSRSVTREAVKMLTAKGVLTARPRKGTTIQPVSAWNMFDADILRWILEKEFSLERLRQFTELRIAIEPAAAALAAAAAGPDAIVAIREGLAQMEAAEGHGDEALDADIAFHLAILEASGNPFYVQFRDVVETALRTSIRFTNQFHGRTASLPAHEAVLNAIERGDGEAAGEAMRRIIADVMALIRSEERRIGGTAS